jgi:hypothetical protein
MRPEICIFTAKTKCKFIDLVNSYEGRVAFPSLGQRFILRNYLQVILSQLIAVSGMLLIREVLNTNNFTGTFEKKCCLKCSLGK